MVTAHVSVLGDLFSKDHPWEMDTEGCGGSLYVSPETTPQHCLCTHPSLPFLWNDGRWPFPTLRPWVFLNSANKHSSARPQVKEKEN